MKVLGKDNAYDVEIDTEGNLNLNGETVNLDVISESENSFYVIRDGVGYDVYIVDKNPESKTYSISINGHKYEVQAKSKFDELLNQLGMSSMMEAKADDLKAPMPGLVLDILVEAESEVKKGDALLVLEAMKMENNIKASAEGVVKSVDIKKGQAVEKNQVLISFE